MLWRAFLRRMRSQDAAACCCPCHQESAKGNITLIEAVLPLIDWTYSNFGVFSASRILQGQAAFANDGGNCEAIPGK